MRLKVLAISFLFPNPVHTMYGIFVYHRLRALQAFNDIRVIAPLQWYPCMAWLRPLLAGYGRIRRKERFKALDVHYPRFPVVPRYLKWFDAVSCLLAVWPVARRLARDGFIFDIVDVHWTYPDILAGYVLAQQAGKPFIVTIRGREALYLEERSLRKRLLDSLLRKADGVVVLSQELADLAAAIGVVPERIRMVLNGVDTDTFRPTDRSEARSRLNLPLDKKIVLSVGRLTEAKGHQHIMAAVAALPCRNDVALHIIGGFNPESDHSRHLLQMAADLGPADIQFHTGVHHEELGVWYNAADLFCLASKGEGCPNVVLEALACGTPVVVTDVGSVREIVQDGVNGYIVGTPSNLDSALERGLTACWDRSGIAAGMKQMSWEACADRVNSIYYDTIASSGEPVPAVRGGGV